MNGYHGRVNTNRVTRRRLLGAGASFSMGAAALALIGCGTNGEQVESADATGGAFSPVTGEPRRGGKYATVGGSVNNYSIIENSVWGLRISGPSVYDRPLTVKLDGRRFVLEAAEKIEVVEPTKVVMTLKPGLVFENKAPVNGRAVTAADIKATQDFVKALPSAYDSNFQRLFLDRTEVSGDRTITFHLSQPSAYLFSSSYLGSPYSQSLIPQEHLDRLRDEPPIGSGPFAMSDHTFNSKYTFRRSETYRDAAKVYFDEFESLSLQDPVAQESAFRSGQLSYWQPPAATVDRLAGELDKQKFSSANFLSPSFNGINAMMNQAYGARPWNDVRVREAFYRLTNKQQIISLALKGKAVETWGMLQASLPDYLLDQKDTEKYFRLDLAKAKSLLSAANYDASREWDVVMTDGTAISLPMAEVWQQQLSEGGIRIKPTRLPTAEMLNRVGQGQFDFFIGSSVSTDVPARPLRYQHSKTGFAFSNIGLYDPAIDALIEKSEALIDINENIKLVKDIQMKALEKYSLSVPLLTEQLFSFYDARLQNLEIDPLINQTYQVGAWFGVS